MKINVQRIEESEITFTRTKMHKAAQQNQDDKKKKRKPDYTFQRSQKRGG